MFNEENSIFKFKMSVRARNILIKSGLSTVEKFLAFSEIDFSAIQGTGSKTVDEFLKLQINIKNQSAPLNDIEDDFFSVSTVTSCIDTSDDYTIFIGKDGYEYVDVKITKLGLSRRPLHQLTKKGITHASSLINYTEEDYLRIPNMGSKSVVEILKAMDNLIFEKVDSNTTLDNKVNSPVLDSKEGLFAVQPIETLGLSTRSCNCLRMNNIMTVTQFLELSAESLYALRNLGKKSVLEILSFQKMLQNMESSTLQSFQSSSNIIEKDMCSPEDRQKILTVVQKIVSKLDCDTSELFLELKELVSDYNIDILLLADDESDLSFVSELYSLPSFCQGLKLKILSFLEKLAWGTSQYELCKLLPYFLQEYDGLFFSFLEKLQLENLIFYNRMNLFEKKRQTASEFAQTVKNERNKELLLRRLSGDTLEDIGTTYGLTRERVRQITTITLNKSATLIEDKYQELFETYLLDIDDFKVITREADEVYFYLLARYKRGSLPFDELRFDGNFPIIFQKAAESLAYRNYVFIKGEYVLKRRPELIEYVLRTHGKSSITFEMFEKIYHELLVELNLSNNQTFTINSRGQENQLANSSYTLCKYGKKYRYYAIEVNDYTALVEMLNISSYVDVEISTKRWFDTYPNLMEEYDIQDEYELHNLLKKLNLSVTFPTIKIKRMPNIEFGTADREKQVLDLLMIHAPIGNVELAELYEKEFGVLTSTVLANYFGHLDQYYHEGMYRIDFSELNPDILDSLRALLTDDLYFISSIRKIYSENFQDANQIYINPRTLKQLGFLVFDNYVINKKCNTAAEYFRFFLLGTDIVDLNILPKGTKTLISFYCELYKLRASYDIIEYEPTLYINIRRLAKMDITLDHITDYTKSVREFVVNPYFTIHSLRQSGFVHELDDLGFKDHFYGAILTEDKENFTTVRLGNLNRIFYRGKSDFKFTIFYSGLLILASTYFLIWMI